VLGHPCLSYVARRTNLIELLLDARRFPEREYIVHGDRRRSFAEHESAVHAVAAVLRARGIGPGQRVLLLGRNSPEWVAMFWAVIESGAIVVLGNAWWSEAELAHVLDVTSPSLVAADSRFAQALPARQDRLILAELANAAESWRGTAVAPVVDEDAPAVILYTSGTTGLPKGAVLSHRGMLATLQSLLERTRRLPVDGAAPPDASAALLSLPLFHIGGLQQIITPMVTGGTLVFTEGRFDPEIVVRLIEEENVRVWSVVPTMAARVIEFLAENGLAPVHQLRTLGLGGSPVVGQLRQQIREWFPNVSRGFAVTYGLSEAGGVVSTGAGAALAEQPQLVGAPLRVATVRIERPTENGEGEVLVRSPSVMLGYWTKEACDDPSRLDPGPIDSQRWLHSGDIGRLDSEGQLYITDRSKDIVIRGGENIACPHIESRLLEHPAVREAAVFGLPHPTLGEELAAVVVVNEDDRVTADDLAAHAAGALAYFEVPSQWKIRTEPLPQNAIGKVLKRAVRADWLVELEAL
jgi:long-chain acyl-CoA synthetase